MAGKVRIDFTMAEAAALADWVLGTNHMERVFDQGDINALSQRAAEKVSKSLTWMGK